VVSKTKKKASTKSIKGINRRRWRRKTPIKNVITASSAVLSSVHRRISKLLTKLGLTRFSSSNRKRNRYKNFLRIDVVAADVDDLRAWKGWVESRLRQLTLMIERDTIGKLQCHPYPREYIDDTRKSGILNFQPQLLGGE